MITPSKSDTQSKPDGYSGIISPLSRCHEKIDRDSPRCQTQVDDATRELRVLRTFQPEHGVSK